MSDLQDQLTNTPDSTAEFDQADIDANKGISVLSYFGILFLIPFFCTKESKFARFHANQGLVLFIVEIAINIVFSGILGKIMYLFSVIGGLLDVVVVVFAVMGIINAATGKAKELPLIGGIKILN